MSVCLGVCVRGSLTAAASLLLLLLTHRFSFLSLCCLLPFLFLSVLLSTCRALSISRQHSVSSPSRSEKPFSGLSLVGNRVWRKITDQRTCERECVCVFLCVCERGVYYKEAGLTGRWWCFFSSTHLIDAIYSHASPVMKHEKTAWESVCTSVYV